MVNPFDIYPPVTLEKYPFLKENKYFEYVINLTPSQIKDFGENNIITLDFTSNKEPYKVFLTKSQIKKVETVKKLGKKVDLKFSKTQFKKTLPYVTRLNRSQIKQRAKDRLEILKSDNAKKAKQLKKLKLQDQLETLKKENAKKAKQLKLQDQFETLKTENARKAKQLMSLKNKINLDNFVKNTLKELNKPKPKPKPKPKKKISDNWFNFISEIRKNY